MSLHITFAAVRSISSHSQLFASRENYDFLLFSFVGGRYAGGGLLIGRREKMGRGDLLTKTT